MRLSVIADSVATDSIHQGDAYPATMTLAILAGILSGIGSGFFAAIVTPFAARRAEETQQRQASRRQLVADARTMLAEANDAVWEFESFMSDATYLALSAHLSKAVREEYEGVSIEEQRHGAWVQPDVPFDSLRTEIARIEREWNLV